MKNKRLICLLLSADLIFNPIMSSAKSRGLTERQEKTADKVAKVAMDSWKEYGVLPSVAVAQTFIESSLGENQVRKNNLWGLRPGGEYSFYPTLDRGIYAYLEVLNNGIYKKALYLKSYTEQLDFILKGGYYGEDDGGTNEEYYKNCISSIEKYGFFEYDKEMFEKIRNEEKRRREKRRKKKWGDVYTLHYDPSLNINEIKVNKKNYKKRFCTSMERQNHERYF